MVTFGEYLRFVYEGRVPSMFADLAVAPQGPQLFHKDVGIPAGVSLPAPGLRLSYGSHSQDRQNEKIPDSVLPKALPQGMTLIEVETNQGRTVKWVVRFAFSADNDLVMAVTPDGFVKTVWLNKKTDLHRTLDRSRYTSPKKFKAN